MAEQMSTLLNISSDQYSVVLEVFGYESAQQDSWNESNWLNCKAKLRIGEWLTDFKFSCFTTDLSIFSKGLTLLKNNSKSVAELIPLEPDFQLRVLSNGNNRYELTAISDFRSRRECEFRSEVHLKLCLTLEDVIYIAEQANVTSEMFPERRPRVSVGETIKRKTEAK
jgi:hypothetical protein